MYFPEFERYLPIFDLPYSKIWRLSLEYGLLQGISKLAALTPLVNELVDKTLWHFSWC